MSSGLLKWQPGHNLSKRTILAMHFQGIPLVGVYYICEDVIGDGVGRCSRCPGGGGWVCVLEAQFSLAKGVKLGSPKDYCLVSSLDSRPLKPRRLQLTSAGSLAR